MLLLLALLASLTASHPPKTGDDVVRSMHDKYAGKWYSTLSYTQKTTQANGTVETWYETMQVPGILRIDIAPLDSGRAILFRHDTLYQFRAWAVTTARPYIHPLMVLGFDVYADSVAATIRKLKTFNIDFSKVSTNTWQGRPVYVVGAAAGDTTSPQFWVDQERLVFVRLFQSRNGVVSETQFNKYIQAGGGWLSAEVLFFSDGKPGTKEEYTNIRTGIKFDAHFFDPEHITPRKES